MQRQAHNLQQGTDPWHQFRLEHHGASEAAAMLGLSKTVKRSELLHMKHTGIAREFSEWVQKNIIDNGHAVEAMARPIIEEMIGDELYPATYSYGKLSASCDGLTMDGETAFEHKQFNAGLFAMVRSGVLPDEYMPQCQQIMLVTGAKRVVFTCSDGTADRMAYMEVLPDDDWQKRIAAGWAQFDADLAAYTPPAPEAVVVAAPVMALPAVSVQVQGALTVVDNLALFGEKLTAFIEGVNKEPKDDQEFANCESAIKTLQDAQDALEEAEARALGQAASIDELRRTVALYRDQARNTRLLLEKVVKQRKEQIKAEIVAAGKQALADHIAGLNARIGKPWVPTVACDFVAAAKNKRNLASLRDAVNLALANAKIEASAVADKIQINANLLREHQAHAFLFNDAAAVVLKAPEDFAMLVKARIAEHEQAEQKRLEAERERIRAEEQAKAEREAQARAEAAAQQTASHIVPTPEPSHTPPAPAAKPIATVTPMPAKAKRPSDEEIVAALAEHFGVSKMVVIGWLSSMTLLVA